MRAHIATLLICLNYLLPATRNHSLVWRHAALWRAIRYRLGGLLANRTGLPFVTPWNSRNSTTFLLDQHARECRRNFSLLIHLTGRHRTKHCWPVETKCLAGSKLKSSLLHSSGLNRATVLHTRTFLISPTISLVTKYKRTQSTTWSKRRVSTRG